MSRKNYKEESRKDWGVTQEAALTIEQINIGAVLRIADACELMAKDREKLEAGYKYMRERRDYYSTECERMVAKWRAGKGQITRLKKRIAALEEQLNPTNQQPK